jgi:hypothetical protein
LIKAGDSLSFEKVDELRCSVRRHSLPDDHRSAGMGSRAGVEGLEVRIGANAPRLLGGETPGALP